MRTIYGFILCSAALLLTLHAQPQLFWQNPVPYGNIVTSAKFFDSQNWLLACDAGTLLRTTDGGATWKQQTSPVLATIDFRDMFFINANTGWLVGASKLGALTNALLKTTDGGKNWTSTTYSIGGGLRSVFFIDAQTGWIGAENGKIAKTTDGGSTWVAETTSVTDPVLQIYFFNSSYGYLKTSNTVLKTTNGGTTWAYASGAVRFTSMWKINQDTIYCGDQYIINKSTDGGQTWAASGSFSSGVGTVTSLYFLDPSTGFGCTDNELIVRTTDYGKTWTKNYLMNTKAYGLTRMTFFDANNGAAVGNYGHIYKTSDGGTTWTPLFNGLLTTMYASFFVDKNYGWVAGTNNSYFGIGRTTDGGRTWTFNKTIQFVKALFFLNRNLGWAAGDAVTYKTTDGGVTWNSLPAALGQKARTIFFVDSLYGWMGGNNGSTNGALQRTTDGGTTWTTIAGVQNPIYSIYFSDRNNGYRNENNKIYKSTDGGNTWTQTANTGDKFQFMDPLNGLMFDSYANKFKKTTDGGNTWTSYSLPTLYSSLQYEFRFFHFFNLNYGIYGGGSGITYKTTDGGQTWNPYYIPLGGTVYSVYMADTNAIWITGDYGAIVSTIAPNTTEVRAIDVSMPSSTSLEQNYPNPFNPSTVIRYKLDKDNFTRLTIYNVLGSEVAVLINRSQTAGTYSVQFDAGRLPAGVYLYQLQTGGSTVTKKMLLLK